MPKTLSLTPKQQAEYSRIRDRLVREGDALDALRANDLMNDEELKYIADMLYVTNYLSKDERVRRDFRKVWFRWVEDGLFGERVVEGETK